MPKNFQTLSLVKVTQTAVVPSPSSNLKKEPWLFRMTSPAKPGQNPPSWVSYQSQVNIQLVLAIWALTMNEDNG